MTDRTISQVETRIAALKATKRRHENALSDMKTKSYYEQSGLDRVTKQLAKLEIELKAFKDTHPLRMPVNDPFQDGDVIKFERAYHEGGMYYTYAAIKFGDLWYTTAKNEGIMTWPGLREFLRGKVKSVTVMKDNIHIVKDGTFNQELHDKAIINKLADILTNSVSAEQPF